ARAASADPPGDQGRAVGTWALPLLARLVYSCDLCLCNRKQHSPEPPCRNRRARTACRSAAPRSPAPSAPRAAPPRSSATSATPRLRYVIVGDVMLLDDGLLQLEVLEIDGEDVVPRVLSGGPRSDHKGINLPGVQVSAPAMSEKDRADLVLGQELGVDFVALS